MTTELPEETEEQTRLNRNNGVYGRLFERIKYMSKTFKQEIIIQFTGFQ